MSDPSFSVTYYPVYWQVSTELLDDRLPLDWTILRDLGDDAGAMRLRRRMLEKGMREGVYGPAAKLP